VREDGRLIVSRSSISVNTGTYISLAINSIGLNIMLYLSFIIICTSVHQMRYITPNEIYRLKG